MFSDPLDAARLWEESADAKEKASCEFESGALVVRRLTAGSFRCKAPPHVEPDDLRTEVAVRLLSKGSCASVWLRFRPYLGYQVRICESVILVGTHKNTEAVELRKFPLADAPVPIDGPPTTITLDTVDGVLEVRRDGRPVGTMELTDPDIGSGRVLLGIFTEPADAGRRAPYAVAFDQVDIYDLS